ncbi:MAG TPA: hypothetical protein VMH20_02310 [Verrucomicrobiae bacterium]|nr:hypothetical protein [Verrucomicrobiae bacterium]
MSHQATREELERDAIRLLCSELIDPETRQRLGGLLKTYVFEGELNDAVYEAVLSVGAVSSKRLRELLPGRVTNLGFPDFDLKEYLGQGEAVDDIDRLFEHLLELTDDSCEDNHKAMGQSA